jgi:putative Holliday junction resolvase
MNVLAIDYGSKRIGLAIAIENIIEPIAGIKNDADIFKNINKVISDYQIKKIYVGISEGEFARLTQKFVTELKNVLTLPIETVEEAVSTIEANQVFLANRKHKKNYKKTIDSIAAAVVLRRVIS